MAWSTIDDAVGTLARGGVVLVIADPGLTPADLARPGHVMPERTGDATIPTDLGTFRAVAYRSTTDSAKPWPAAASGSVRSFGPLLTGLV